MSRRPTWLAAAPPHCANGIGTTVLNGVNDHGQLVGFYVDGNGNTDGFLAGPLH